MIMAVQVLRTPGMWVPLVNLQNVYILPGIPRLFQAMIGTHRERFQGPATLSEELYSNLGEGDLAGKHCEADPSGYADLIITS